MPDKRGNMLNFGAMLPMHLRQRGVSWCKHNKCRTTLGQRTHALSFSLSLRGPISPIGSARRNPGIPGLRMMRRRAREAVTYGAPPGLPTGKHVFPATSDKHLLQDSAMASKGGLRPRSPDRESKLPPKQRTKSRMYSRNSSRPHTAHDQVKSTCRPMSSKRSAATRTTCANQFAKG